MLSRYRPYYPAFRKLTRSLRASWFRRRELFDFSNVYRPSDEIDVCIVNAGSADLSAAIRLKQLEQ